MNDQWSKRAVAIVVFIAVTYFLGSLPMPPQIDFMANQEERAP